MKRKLAFTIPLDVLCFLFLMIGFGLLSPNPPSSSVNLYEQIFYNYGQSIINIVPALKYHAFIGGLFSIFAGVVCAVFSIAVLKIEKESKSKANKGKITLGSGV